MRKPESVVSTAVAQNSAVDRTIALLLAQGIRLKGLQPKVKTRLPNQWRVHFRANDIDDYVLVTAPTLREAHTMGMNTYDLWYRDNPQPNGSLPLSLVCVEPVYE